jgi:YfiH family protein
VSRLGPGIGYLVTERHGGASTGPFGTLNLGLAVGDDPMAVTANRQRVAASCGLQPEDIAWMTQVHGAVVRYAGPGWAADAAGPCDAIFTDAPRLALAVQVADCVPVLVADPVGRLAGAAHAGRAGLAAGVVTALVTAMTAAGGQPGRMRALIGPAICGGCYQVPDAMQDEVSAVVPEARCQTRAGTAGLDLVAGVAAQLAAAGVGPVSRDGRCTRESADLYSYRRDGTTGRFAALAWLEP